MDTIELLLAAKVLDIAGTLRKSAWAQFAAANGLPAAQQSEGMTDWRAAHPASEFVPSALGMLDEVALQIRDIRAASSPAPQSQA